MNTALSNVLQNQSTCKMHEKNFHFVSFLFGTHWITIKLYLMLYRNKIKMNRNRKRDLYKCEFFLHPIFLRGLRCVCVCVLPSVRVALANRFLFYYFVYYLLRWGLLSVQTQLKCFLFFVKSISRVCEWVCGFQTIISCLRFLRTRISLYCSFLKYLNNTI